ncbi:MAG: hypothetical protein LBE84_08885 [Planctomycetota bacterium]|jgi:hypothetical protein|nr:hypothetical protein [Planctomycetota bacterium]
MGTISIGVDAIRPGMRLAKSLLDPGGNTLLPAGIRLTPIFASRIRKWGIAAIEVESHDTRAALSPNDRTVVPSPEAAPDPGPERNPLAEQIVGEVDERFINVAGDALMMKLRGIVIRRLLTDGGKGVSALVQGQKKGPAGQCP